MHFVPGAAQCHLFFMPCLLEPNKKLVKDASYKAFELVEDGEFQLEEMCMPIPVLDLISSHARTKTRALEDRIKSQKNETLVAVVILGFMLLLSLLLRQ